jgi:molybdenum cofactor synthesis domain-containing protein
VRAAILTIGNEIVSGDTENTNASWLARRLASRGVEVVLVAAVPDELEAIARWVREAGASHDLVLVTGGLGGTPDDITREALSAAFGVGQAEVAELAHDLRARFPRNPEYAARFAHLPSGSTPLENPLGGAPGFALGNVYVLPGLPAEMRAMFEVIVDELGSDSPIRSWRRTYRTTEAEIAALLEEAVRRFPGVLVGSYPDFGPTGPSVEVVLKSAEEVALAAASEWLGAALALVGRDS